MLGNFDLEKSRKKQKTPLFLKFLFWLAAFLIGVHYIYLLSHQTPTENVTISQIQPLTQNTPVDSIQSIQILQDFKNEFRSFVKQWEQSGMLASQAQSFLNNLPLEISSLNTKLDEVAGNVKSVQTVSTAENGSTSGPLKKIRVFIGVFTGFNVKQSDDPRYDYVKRRTAMRETWFPESQDIIDQLEKELGYVIRYVIGHIDNQVLEDQITQESEKYGGFMRLNHMETYEGLPQKTKTFFSTVASKYDADYIVKMDDDVYLKLDRLGAGMKQWEKMGAQYIGCMKHGQVFKSGKWLEPNHLMLASDYYLHAYGSIYVISGQIAREVILKNQNYLRMLANEDTSVGIWMLGHNVTYFEDMRLCTPGCSVATIGVLNNACAGLCDPLSDFYTVHTNDKCTAELLDPLPYLPSYPDHKDFEAMRV